MRKTYLLWFACLAFLISGCRNEDFYQSSYGSAREEEFFRDAEKLTSRFPQFTEIIDLLKNENERSHFISKMSDQKGLPVWSKMDLKKSRRTVGKGEGDLMEIVIPLTEDQKTLSSLLFVTETADGLLQINNTNNEALKNIVFDSSISSDVRENYLLNFILADRVVFGTSKYINIPADLLEDIPVNDGVNLKSFEVTSTTIDNTPTENATSGMICFDIEVPKPNCDCHGTVTHTVCFLVFNPDTGGDGGSGGGSPGGGGTGGGSGTPNPGGYDPNDDGGSNDPCFNRAFYRLQAPNTPPCDVVLYVSPCEKLKSRNNDSKFKEKVAALDKPEVFDYDHEMGYAVSYPPAGTGLATQYQPMDNNVNTHKVKLPDGNRYFGYMHTHNNEMGTIKIFSHADLATFLSSCVTNAQASGNIKDSYAMVITSAGNYTLAYTGTNTNFGIGPNTLKFWRAWYLREYEDLIKNDELTQLNIEKTFLRFLAEKVKINGVELYKNDKTTGIASRLSLDNNNNVISTPCP